MWTLRLSLALVLSLAFVANGYVTQKEFQRRHENGELNFELSIAEILRLIGTGEYSAYNPPQMPHCVVQEPTRYRNDAPMRGKPGEPRQKPVPVGVGKPETEGVEEAEVIVVDSRPSCFRLTALCFTGSLFMRSGFADHRERLRLHCSRHGKRTRTRRLCLAYA